MYEVLQIHQCWCNQHCKVWPPSTSCPDSYVFIFALCYSSVHSTNIYYATTVCHPHMLLSPMIQIPLLLFQTTTLALGMQYIRVIRLLLLLSLFSCVWLSATPWMAVHQRLLCPWDSPGKNTGVGCISFSNACMHAKSLQLCPTLCDPMDSRGWS